MDEKRLVWADVLRVAAIFGVILLHSAAPLLLKYRTAGAASWWVGNAYDSAVRWCVPLFVMLSGALLLGRDQPVWQFLTTRFRRVAVPFLVWSVVYFFWARHFRGLRLELEDLPRLLVYGPAYYHLWFLQVILALYLLVPPLRALLKKIGRRGGWALLAAWFVLALLLPEVLALAGWREAPDSVHSSPLRYAGYLLLGYLLRDVLLSPHQARGVASLLFAGWALTAAGTWLLTVRQGGGRFDGFLYEYFAVNVLLMSLAVFLLGKSAPLRRFARAGGRAARGLQTLSASALGVYLVHAMVIDLLKSGHLGTRIDETSVHPLLGVPLFAAAVFVISWAIVSALKRIPIVCKAVP